MLSTERLEELAKGYETWGKTNSAQPQIDLDTASALRELLAIRTQSPAEWQVEAAIRQLASFSRSDIEWHDHEDDIRMALRAASITPPAPERSKEEARELSVADALAQLNAAIEAEKRRNTVRDEMLATVIVNLEKSEMTAEFAVLLRDYVRAERAKLSALEPASLHKGEDVWGWAKPDHPAAVEPLAIKGERPEWATSVFTIPLRASPAPVPLTITDAARDVLAERKRQVEKEGWTPEHDDAHDGGEMARAAACYALGSHLPTHEMDGPGSYVVPDYWPWAGEWWKPKGRRLDLVRAGALILAEIERIDRALEQTKGAEDA